MYIFKITQADNYVKSKDEQITYVLSSEIACWSPSSKTIDLKNGLHLSNVSDKSIEDLESFFFFVKKNIEVIKPLGSDNPWYTK